MNMEEHKEAFDFIDQILSDAQSFSVCLKNRCSELQTNNESAEELKGAWEKHQTVWKSLKDTQQAANDELESRWKMECETKRDKDTLEQEVDALVAQNKVLENQVQSVQTCQAQVSAETRQAELDSIAMAQQLLVHNPREKFLKQLVQNITNMKWTVEKSDDGDHLKGSVKSSVKGTKHFDYDLQRTSPASVVDSLWTLMDEGKRFAEDLPTSQS